MDEHQAAFEQGWTDGTWGAMDGLRPAPIAGIESSRGASDAAGHLAAYRSHAPELLFRRRRLRWRASRPLTVLTVVVALLVASCGRGPAAPSTASVRSEPSVVASTTASSIDAPSSSVEFGSAVFVGDSMVREASAYLPDVAPNERVEALARFGGAPCDLVRSLRDRLAAEPVDVVVLSFAGNGASWFSPCMDPASTPDAVGARYAADLPKLIDLARGAGARVALVTVPAAGEPATEARWARVRSVVREVGAALDVAVFDGGADVAPHDRFQVSAPCEAWEPCDQRGVVTLRSPDRIHFCPVAHEEDVTGPPSCPVPSPGAERFARALVAAATSVAGAR